MAAAVGTVIICSTKNKIATSTWNRGRHLAAGGLYAYKDPMTVNLRGPNDYPEHNSFLPDDDTRIFFIHVGKAGGMTLRDSVISANESKIKCAYKNSLSGKDYRPCYKFQPEASQLDQKTLGIFHMNAVNMKPEEQQWLLDNTNVFLFSVRDPIDRLLSAYNYHRQLKLGKGWGKGVFYTQCFPNGLDEMVQRVAGMDTMLNEYCRRLGVDTLLGKENRGGGEHFQYGYQWYKSQSMDKRPSHQVAAVRTERMWEDISHLDQLLGGTGEFEAAGSKNTHGSESYTFSYSGDLTYEHTRFLCCLIYKEIEAYQLMILKAMNLGDVHKRLTLSHLMKRCFIEIPATQEHLLLEEPFSWEAFYREETCKISLAGVEKYVN
jgi:hypothetical protein